MTGSARWLVPPVAVLLTVGAAGCTADATTPPPAASPAPFADCAALTASSPSAGADLPDVALPCFTGDTTVRLSDLRGPAVLNVWGSWCAPCRTELPMIQHLADRSKGQLTVLGVDTRDSRESAASFAADHRITMPMLFDPEQKLLGRLGRSNVPLTVFVNSAGQTYVDPLPLDPDKLTETVRQHTGVTVTP